MIHSTAGFYLAPFQTKAVNTAASVGKRLLMHPMGSGKTITALCLLRNSIETEGGYFLYITPASLIQNVDEMMRRFFPSLSSNILGKDNQLPSANVVNIASYDQCRLLLPNLLSTNFRVVVADEIHHVKDKRSKTFPAISAIANRSLTFLGMSGSPYQNCPEEFFSIIEIILGISSRDMVDRFLEREWDYSKSTFIWRFINTVILKRPVKGPFKGIQNSEELSHLLSGNFIFASETEIGRFFPFPAVEFQIHNIPLSIAEHRLYDYACKSITKETMTRFMAGSVTESEITQIVNKLAAARQVMLDGAYVFRSNEGRSRDAVPGSKIQHCVKIILSNPGGKFLLFTNFVQCGVKAIAHELKNSGMNFLVITGKTSAKQRNEIVTVFNELDSGVLVLSPVGGEGLDFRNVDHVIILDPHFNPNVMSQMWSRARRVGSIKKTVIVHILLAVDSSLGRTVDHAIFGIAKRKHVLGQEIHRAITGNIEHDPSEEFFGMSWGY